MRSFSKLPWTAEEVHEELETLHRFQAAGDAEKGAPSQKIVELRASVDERIRRFQFAVAVPFAKKDIAKRLGGQWFGDAKMWLMPDAEAVQKVKEAL